MSHIRFLLDETNLAILLERGMSQLVVILSVEIRLGCTDACQRRVIEQSRSYPVKSDKICSTLLKFAAAYNVSIFSSFADVVFFCKLRMEVIF